MSFKTDNSGCALRIEDAKINFGYSFSWLDWLSELEHISGNVYIMTYSLPDMHYIQYILAKRPHDIFIIAHSKFLERAVKIKETYPDIHIALCDYTHAKVVLTEPNTVWLSSANFGRSNWLENTIGIHSQKAFEYYKFAFKNTFDNSTQVHERICLVNTKLNKCPFCGSSCSERDAVFSDDGIYVECPECGACGWPENTTDEAVKTWNARNKPFSTRKGIISIREDGAYQ